MRASLIAALLGVLASGAMAQDFNAAPPNAARQTPAFEGQTRAPVINDNVSLQKEVIASGLDHPWGMAELPGGAGWLVSERAGALRHIAPDGTVSAPITGLPEVVAEGQGGLLDVVLGPDFAQDRRIWWSYAARDEGSKTTTAVATGVLSPDHGALSDVREVFRQTPAWNSRLHYGSRLVFDRTGALFITKGERSNPAPRKLAQDPGTHLGKVIRIAPMGGAAPGNPALTGWAPEVWSIGHRNMQGATLGPDGQLWTIEHGPRGGDELNRPEAGKNYGWPVITYGEAYSGMPIGGGVTAKEGMEQPLYYWDSVIAPSGMTFYDGRMFEAWRGSLLIGGLRSQALVRLTLDGARVTGEARYELGLGRVRDVEVSRTGAVMVLIDADNGALVRLTRQ